MVHRSIRTTHIITHITTGGAESMLYKLLSALDAGRHGSAVVSLMHESMESSRIVETLGVPVHYLGMRKGRPTSLALWRLARLARSLNTQLIQGWMYHGNLAALAFKYLAGNKPPVVWNIRHSLYNLKDEKPLTRMMIRAGARMSAKTDRIIYNSQTSASHHESFGYQPSRRVVLPNGFDTDHFRPSEAARRALRQELGVAECAALVGMIARYHPVKDHGNFIQAADHVHAVWPDVHFVMVGREVTLGNPLFRDRVNVADAKAHFHLLGERRDIPELMAALDMLVSSSWTESFPNVIGEAMASGVACVVTDVGDSASILGGYGVVVPPRDPCALAKGISDLLGAGEEGRRLLGLRARQRILDEYSQDKVAAQYDALYNEVLAEQLP